MQYLIILEILLLQLTSVLAQVYLQAETFPLVDNTNIKQRSSASKGLALLMPDYATLQYDLCIGSPVQLDLKFRYSKTVNNDVNINIFIDKSLTSIHKTTGTQGSNNFVDSSAEPLFLMNGKYTLTLQIDDKSGSGFEMDYIKLSSPTIHVQEDIVCSKYETIQRSTSLEVEQLTNGRFSWRSNASQKKSVLLNKGDSVTYDICIDSAVNMTIEEVVYSNDGDTDVVKIDIDGNQIGDFNTVAGRGGGRLWNFFRSVGPIGDVIRFQPGKYKLTLSVIEADSFGVELDYISFSIGGFSTKQNPLQCGVDLELEAEQFENARTKMRSSASNGLTVHLNKDESVTTELCIGVDTTVSLNKLVYSNDGMSDTIVISIDNVPQATAITQSQSNGGFNWNVFKDISLNSKSTIQEGKHEIILKAIESDSYGVELDKLGLNLNFRSPSINWWTCPNQKNVLIEAENFQPKTSQGKHYRSKASAKRTVYLKTGNKITQTICVTGKVKLSLNNIMASNDGGKDSVAIKVQSITVATFNTIESFGGGEGWNDIHAYQLTTDIFLNKGEYDIDIEALKTDKYGVEIDALAFKTESVEGGILYPSECEE